MLPGKDATCEVVQLGETQLGELAASYTRAVAAAAVDNHRLVFPRLKLIGFCSKLTEWDVLGTHKIAGAEFVDFAYIEQQRLVMAQHACGFGGVDFAVLTGHAGKLIGNNHEKNTHRSGGEHPVALKKIEKVHAGLLGATDTHLFADGIQWAK